MLEPRIRLAALAGWLTSTLVSGCSPSILLVPLEEIPDAVDYLALLPLVGDSVEPGSGLLSKDGPSHSALSITTDDDRMLLVGYSKAQLLGASDDVLAASPLRLAEAPDARLPPAEWSSAVLFEEGRGVLSEPPEFGALTASWAQCAFDPARQYVHVRCVSCSPFVKLELEGCELSIDTRGCFLGVEAIRVPLGGSGGFGAPTIRDQTCELIADPEPSRLAFECTIPQAPFECRFDLVERVPEEQVPFSVTRRALVTRPLPELDFVSRLDVYGRGYVPDLVVVGDRVIASVHDREASNWICADGGAGQLVVLQADTLEPIEAVQAPPCLYTMAQSPNPEEFVAIHGDPLPIVSRFDASGRVLDARALSAVVPFARARAIDLELRPDGMLVALINEVADDLSRPDLGALWLVIDPVSLEVRDSRALVGHYALLRVDPDGRSSAASLSLEYVVSFDEEGPIPSESYRFVCDTSAIRAGDHSPLGGNRHLLIGRQLYPFIFAVDFDARTCARDAIAELEADPSSLLRLGEHQYLVTARGRDPERRATLLRFDAARVLLAPGSLDIGQGLTRLRRIDERGRVFGVGVESGHVFRIDPR